MDSFEKAYEHLNPAQRQAVDSIDGPLLVLAGPGTGKTQLLSTRVANILQKTDASPSNILCLTFTEAGKVAMQKRLVKIMGDTGAHVAVHTFHSFGSEIMSRYPQYFHDGLEYMPTDEVNTHEILLDIIDELPHDHPLATKKQDEFVYLNAVKGRLKELKKAAITPDELRALTIQGLEFVEYIESHIIDLFDVSRFSSESDIQRAAEVMAVAAKYKIPEQAVPGIPTLVEVFTETFGRALDSAQSTGKPKPLNDWKSPWYGKDKEKRPICKQRPVHERLLALADIYERYQEVLATRRLFDFDDMITRVVQAVENEGDLAYDLQEQYQYFLVDEFQDTNAGQMRLVNALASHSVHEGRPNILVVGDDDQAIFAFQGAEMSNILGFEKTYNDVQTITLNQNYRSKPEILTASRQLIAQGSDRLENHHSDITKELTSGHEVRGELRLVRELFTTQAEEHYWIASEILALLKTGHKPQEIAVICREHKYLADLVPYLAAQNIPVWYERQQDALKNPVVRHLVLLARTVYALATGDHDQANAFLPELLSAEYWQIPAEDIWKLSLTAATSYDRDKTWRTWLEIMAEWPTDSPISQAYTLIVHAAQAAAIQPVELVLDLLLGNVVQEFSDNTEPDDASTQPQITLSPIKSYYFSEQALRSNPAAYTESLSALVALRNALRGYHPDSEPKLADFVQFIDLCISSKTTIGVIPTTGARDRSVQLVTVHGSKGLEYETVFMLSVQKDIWDKMPKASALALAPNMLTIAHANNPDDNLRAFFVAMTRAKRQLIMTHHEYLNPGTNPSQAFAALEHASLQDILPRPEQPRIVVDTPQAELQLMQTSWLDRHYKLPQQTIHNLLSDQLDTFALSITALNNFLDVRNGGPKAFLLNNLLHFPSAMNPASAFGDAIHKTLEKIHAVFIDTNKLMTISQVHSTFDQFLSAKHLSAREHGKFLSRGYKTLDQFLVQRGQHLSPAQLPEQNFRDQGVIVASARLTGKLDVIESDGNDVRVIDYKTGKSLGSWDPEGRSDWDKVKQHHYQHQLLFYKLLVDGARDWGGRGRRVKNGELVFVDSINGPQISSLSLDLHNSIEKLERLEKLIGVVWQHIIDLNLPDTSNYKQTIAGILDFEQDLLDGKI